MNQSFDFGVNWKSYSAKALSEEKFRMALDSLKELFGREDFKGLSFLDIGCGSGIFSIAARRMGAAPVVGIDISRNSVEASERNAECFGLKKNEIAFFEADILDDAEASKFGQFDLVYAWGCLHHTGRMWTAIDNACRLVMPGGTMALGIYNRHCTSPLWNVIKRIYNSSPSFIRKPMVWFFYAVIFIAKMAATGKNPMSMKRGMDFYHDVVDWVGGYPYEYASKGEIVDFLKDKGFSLVRFFPTQLPTGNNQFVFLKRPS